MASLAGLPWPALRLAIALCTLAMSVQAQSDLPTLVSPLKPLPPAPPLPLERLTLPPGFSIGLFVDSIVPNARFMTLGRADGQATVVFVSSTTGQVSESSWRGWG